MIIVGGTAMYMGEGRQLGWQMHKFRNAIVISGLDTLKGLFLFSGKNISTT